ncbi:MAG TPA: tol-pal system protein YbgF [Syntrophorhabdaceae bacterium]|nr:tol-pal system protein YbgF [Syntrophorhabdaceae bacterium]HNT68856.1 tol-pal system protein YbgF [Syntrophorhabdaceae bacterium]
MHKYAAVIISIVITLAAGCQTDEQTVQMQSSLSFLQNDLYSFKQETNAKLAQLTKDNENVGKQIVSVYAAVESRDEKIKSIMGKLDELEYQLRTYWSETKAMMGTQRKPDASPGPAIPAIKPGPPEADARYESAYKEAFDAYQKGAYDEAIIKFTKFIESYGGTPLVPNAFYWTGESYMNLKNYEKAIVSFQEIIDKYPKSEKAPRALLSQAEAFSQTKDKKSSTTLLKRIIELYPKSEEAIIAERKLRNLNI